MVKLARSKLPAKTWFATRAQKEARTVPAPSVSDISVINQIAANLRDRYGSGFTILQELVQNADDAGASSVLSLKFLVSLVEP
jgi:hypothetical protein